MAWLLGRQGPKLGSYSIGVLEENPVAWLVARQRGLRAAIWAAVALSLINSLAWAFLSRMFRIPFSPGWPWSALAGLPWLALHLLSWSLFAWAASRFFIEARRTGELEMLLTTPLGAGQVVAGQWRALWRLFFVPALVLAVMGSVGTFLPLLALRSRSGLAQPEMSYVLGLVALNLLHLALGLAALCWLGLWFGLRSRSQAGAVIRTMAVGQVVPYFLNICGMLLVWPLRAFLSRLSGPLPLFVDLSVLAAPDRSPHIFSLHDPLGQEPIAPGVDPLRAEPIHAAPPQRGAFAFSL